MEKENVIDVEKVKREHFIEDIFKLLKDNAAQDNMFALCLIGKKCEDKPGYEMHFASLVGKDVEDRVVPNSLYRSMIEASDKSPAVKKMLFEFLAESSDAIRAIKTELRTSDPAMCVKIPRTNPKNSVS